MARTWRHRSVAVWLAACTLLTAAPFAGAQATADPLAEYAVTPQAGAWLICVTSYSGDHAGYFAGKLIEEIRSRYRLPAYVFNRGAQQRREQDEEIQRRREQQRQYLERMGVQVDVPLRTRAVYIEDQYAVLVGDRSNAWRLLEEKVREQGEGALVVMGSHGRRGIRRLLWGSKAEEVVRECPCPVLVVKVPSRKEPARDPGAEEAASA